MVYIEIGTENPELTYKEFQRIFAEHEASRKPMLAYFFGGESSKKIWCNWCRAAEPIFDSLSAKLSDVIDIYGIAVGNESDWKNTDSSGARINPFFVRSPNIVAVPTLAIATNYHGAFRIAARVSIPEDPTAIDLEEIVNSFIKFSDKN